MATNKIKYSMKNENKIELTAEGRDEFKPTTLEELAEYAKNYNVNAHFSVLHEKQSEKEDVVFKIILIDNKSKIND